MPPKKQDEIDINALPPMKPITVGLRFDCGRSRALKLQAMLKEARSFQRNVTRDEIVAFCKEKGLYVDPASLTDKQKKDSKFMAEVSTELTPEVVNKAFGQLVADLTLQARKAKYQAAQDKLAPPPVKKDDKKDAKKGKEAVAPPPPPVELPPEKEYNKNFDLLFLCQGYPETSKEQVDLVIHIKEKVINWGGVDMALLEEPEDFQEEIEQRMEEFQQAPLLKKQLSEESMAYSVGERNIVLSLKSTRAQSDRNDPLRDLTIKELALEMDLDAEEETLKQFHEQLLEEICQFSLDQTQFQEWIKNKKTQPLLTKEAPKDPFDLEVEKIQQEARQAEEQQRLLEEQQAQEKNKKGAKKEAKKTEQELEAERLAAIEVQRKEEAKKQQIEVALEQQRKMKEKLHLQYYKKQLGQLDLTKTSPIILLEALLDQLQAEKSYLEKGLVPQCLEDVEDAEQVRRVLNGLSLEAPVIQYKQVLIDELDEIEVRSHHARLADSQVVSEREHKIFDNLCFPGVDRHMMPEAPEKSDKLRKALKSRLHPFINVDVFEFERRQTLITFEELLKENEPEQEWWLGDRVYLERHNKNTLRQKFLSALMHDPQVITKYLPDDDALMICLYFKNPPGRILRKRWSAEWRVLPNLEHWINVRNFNSEFFYDIDYQSVGNVFERSKIMYPSDNSLIIATKYQTGDSEYMRYRVVKENIVFGIRGDFYADVPDLRLSVQMAEEKATMNLTFHNGLCIRFTPQGDVVQTYLHQKQGHQAQTLLNLYDNAEINHELEVKRIVTGQGTVIVYKKDGSIIALYANGNVAIYRNDQWTTTNNKGFRKSPKGVDQVPCAIKTDPESGAQVYIRDDQTMVIKYPDGSQYTQHYDGTLMLSHNDTVTVEHPQFATVRVRFDKVKARTDTVIGMGSAYANVGFDNVFERSNDGRVVETYMDGTRVVSYVEKQELPEYKQFKVNRVHILYMSDGGVAKVVDDGEVVLVSSEERVRLNEKGENKQVPNDVDYWLQLFSVADERKCGVFTVDMQRKIIFTKDDESNYFALNEDGTVEAKISVSLNSNQEPGTPDQIPDGLFVDEENKFLPPPKQWVPPRLFLVHNDNTGEEYYSQAQLQAYFRGKQNNPLCTKVIDELPNCRSLGFITELKQVRHNFINVDIPQTLDIVPKTVKKNTSVPVRVFLYRNFLEYKVFDKEDRGAHEQCLVKYDNWQKNIAKTQSEFGVLQKSEQERDAEFMIQMRILESRKSDYNNESYDQAKSRVPIPTEQVIEEPTLQKSSRSPKVVIPPPQQIQPKRVSVTSQQSPMKQTKSMRTKEIEIRGFVENYFSSKDGIEISKTFPLDVFDVKVKFREKIQPAATEVQDQNAPPEEPINNDPIVALENPPAQYPDPQPIIIKPSVFTQAEIDDDVKQRIILEQAIRYRETKRKDFDIYGKERQNIRKVPCLLKTNPKIELNQKYILTDASTENRVKISSMATRVYQHAPSISDMRNEGMHQTIIRTLDKKNTLDELMDRKHLMINNDLVDKLKKDLLVYPVAVRFGELRNNGQYEAKVIVKNEDILAQRIVLKQPENRNIKVIMKQMGSISMGLSRDIFIQWTTHVVGTFTDEFQITSKHAIYTIPISGQIIEQSLYDKLNHEQIKLSSRPLLRKHIRDMKQINKQSDIIGDSQDSDLLPRINYDKNFKIDPYQNQKQVDHSEDEDQ